MPGAPNRRPPRLTHLAARLYVALGVLLVGAVALGQPLVAPPPSDGRAPAEPAVAEPPAPPQPKGHGWAAIAPPNFGTTVVCHFPPRLGPLAVERGTIQVAPGFTGQTEMAAVSDDRVYLALRETPPGPGLGRRVLSVSVLPVAGGRGLWAYPPGRPVVHAALPEASDLIGFGATRFGPVALLRDRAGVGGSNPLAGRRLVVLDGSVWRRALLPWEEPGAASVLVPDHADVVTVVGFPDRLGLFVQAAGSRVATLWTAVLPRPTGSTPTASGGEKSPASAPLPLQWLAQPLPMTLAAAAAGDAVFAPQHVFNVDGQVLGAAWSEGTLRIMALRAGGAHELAALPDVPQDHELVPMDGSETLAVLWLPEAPPAPDGTSGTAPPNRESTTYQIREVSVITGRTMYAGPVRGVGLVPTQFKALAVLLVLVMGVVVVFVLRSEPGEVNGIELPKGVVLAEPSRRLVAGLIDYVPAALLSEAIFKLPAGTLLSPLGLLGREPNLLPLLAALGLACGYSVIGEWIAGRSPGKVLTGCQVLALGAAPVGSGPVEPGRATGVRLRRPRFWQCLVRNLVRWAVPALGLLMFFDPSRRHPGDILARTLVLVPEPPPSEPPDDDRGDG